MLSKLIVALLALSTDAIPVADSAARRLDPASYQIIPPQDSYAAVGKTYGQLSDEWWMHNEKFADPGGMFRNPGFPLDCAENQEGDVWFLASFVYFCFQPGQRCSAEDAIAAGPPPNRTCTIPSSKYVFMPLLNLLDSPDPTNEDCATDNIDGCRAKANRVTLAFGKNWIKLGEATNPPDATATSLNLAIDSDPPVADLLAYTGQSPPGGFVYGGSAGAVSNGFYILLKFEPGAHSISSFADPSDLVFESIRGPRGPFERDDEAELPFNGRADTFGGSTLRVLAEYSLTITGVNTRLHYGSATAARQQLGSPPCERARARASAQAARTRHGNTLHTRTAAPLAHTRTHTGLTPSCSSALARDSD
jgi:hypothetical protein